MIELIIVVMLVSYISGIYVGRRRKTLERVYTRVTRRQGGCRPQRFAQLKNYGKDTYRHIDTDRRFIVA